MFKIKLFIIGLLGAAMFLTSCEDDILGPGTGTDVNAPFVSFQTDDTQSVITFDETLEPNTTFRVKVEFAKNVADLSSVEVLRDGFGLSTTEYDNLDTDIDNNPQAIVADLDKELVTYTYEFTASDVDGDYSYEFEATDADGLTTSESLIITVFRTEEATPPTLEYIGAPSIPSPAGSLVAINLTAVTGTNDLASISVWEDGVLIPEVDTTRLRFENVVFASNPLPLFSPQSEGFVENQVLIRTIAGTHDYIVRVTDTQDNSADIMFTITEQMNMTPIENTFDFVLVSNASGPNVGALDLDNGVAVSSGSEFAELRDLGIDLGLPNATNWLQQVEPVNGASLRIVNLASLPEGFTFASVTSIEQIEEAWATGDATNPSPSLLAGDILVVQKDATVYLIEVEDVVVTANDNEDFYSFGIKF